MRIGIHARFLTGSPCGRKTYTYQLLKAIIALDRDNEFVIFSPGYPDEPINLPDNFRLCIIPNRFKSLDKWDKYFTTTDEFKNNYVEKLFMSYFAIPNNYKGKLYVVIHDLINSQIFLKEYRNFKKFPWKMISTAGIYDYFFASRKLKNVEKVIAISQRTRDIIKQITRIDDEKLVVIYNGIDHIQTNGDNYSIVDNLSIIENNYFLYIGGMYYKKNVGRLIQAYLEYKNEAKSPLSLVLVGQGYWRNKYEKKFIPGIIWLDPIPNEKLVYLYKNCTKFYFPSLFEGFGLPPVEAKLCGSSVSVDKRLPALEILKDKAQQFDGMSVQSIKKSFFTSDSKLPLEKTEIEEYSWKSCALKVLDLLRVE